MIMIHVTDNKNVRKTWAITNDAKNIVIDTLTEHMKFDNLTDCLWIVPGTVDFDKSED